CTSTSAPPTLSLHDALPIYATGAPAYEPAIPPPAPPCDGGWWSCAQGSWTCGQGLCCCALTTVHCGAWLLHRVAARSVQGVDLRSEEHTSELQSRENLVCRL